jgi:hypothetical protein
MAETTEAQRRKDAEKTEKTERKKTTKNMMLDFVLVSLLSLIVIARAVRLVAISS